MIVDHHECGTYFTPFSFILAIAITFLKFIFFIMLYFLSVSLLSLGELTEWKSLIVSLASAFISMFCKEQGITVLVSKSLIISFRTKVS